MWLWLWLGFGLKTNISSVEINFKQARIPNAAQDAAAEGHSLKRGIGLTDELTEMIGKQTRQVG